MRLYLVRHGESVDNVAGLYAGSRDSPLTTHGVLQTRRLGTHLATVTRSSPIRHVFSSDLQRAALTARAIVDAQASPSSSSVEPAESVLSVVYLPDLRERDFRSLEGTKVGSRSAPGTGGYRFRDPETHAEMAVRVDRFITSHLNPLLSSAESCAEPTSQSIVVVAHGMILTVLLKRLLARFSTPAEAERLFPGRSNSDWLASWRNTAYLEAAVLCQTAASRDAGTLASPNEPGVRLQVIGVNRVDHLEGLKKTRGGIGSARFDSKQKTVDSFFKPVPRKDKPASDGNIA